MTPKLLAIAWKDIYSTFKDRNAVAYLFALPVALSVIIGLSFGTGGDINIDEVPVAVVNHDRGFTLGGEPLNLGDVLLHAFVPTGDPAVDADFAPIHELTEGYAYTDAALARRKVADGDLAAAIVIADENFTANALQGAEPAPITLTTDSGRSVGPSIVRSIVNGLTNGMNTVILAQRVGPQALATLAGQTGADESALAEAVARLNAAAMDVSRSAPIQLQQVDLQGETRTFDALQYFAPSMAILFMTFAMAAGATSILTESQQWTLQRVMTTPTPRWVFMGGKLMGTYATGIIQMLVLVVSTTIVARLMGRENAVWGTNIPAIAVLILAVVLAATSLGLLIAALSKTADQSNTYSTIAMLLLGMLGGTFLPIENLPAAISWLPKLTLNYWGIQGFFDIATGEATLSGIRTHVLALVVMGGVLFAVSLWRFNRRLDI